MSAERIAEALVRSAVAVGGGAGLGWLLSQGFAAAGFHVSPLACWLALVTADVPLRRMAKERHCG